MYVAYVFIDVHFRMQYAITTHICVGCFPHTQKNFISTRVDGFVSVYLCTRTDRLLLHTCAYLYNHGTMYAYRCPKIPSLALPLPMYIHRHARGARRTYMCVYVCVYTVS